MKSKTAYTVAMQTKFSDSDKWSRTNWQVMASDKDNARNQAITDATKAGYTVGNCYFVTEGSTTYEQR